MRLPAHFAPIVLTTALLAPAAAAGFEIDAGETGSAYHATLCPPIAAALVKARIDATCIPSPGPVETLRRIAADPSRLGLVPLDALAAGAASHGGAKAFTRVRTDDTRECLVAVTRNRQITSFEAFSAEASRLRVLLPPKGSGGAESFALVQRIDPAGLGKAKSVLSADSAAEAVKLALSAEDTIAFLTLVPNPYDPLLKTISAEGGHVVPVMSREILRHQIDGQKVYFAEEIQVSRSRWTKATPRLVTACTPSVLVTGASERIADVKVRADLRDLIATLSGLKPGEIVKQPGLVRRLVDRSRDLTAAGAERLRGLTEKAREGSQPYVDKAKEATAKAVEASRPAYEKAKEKTAEAIAKAQQRAKEMMEDGKAAEDSKKE